MMALSTSHVFIRTWRKKMSEYVLLVSTTIWILINAGVVGWKKADPSRFNEHYYNDSILLVSLALINAAALLVSFGSLFVTIWNLI